MNEPDTPDTEAIPVRQVTAIDGLMRIEFSICHCLSLPYARPTMKRGANISSGSVMVFCSTAACQNRQSNKKPRRRLAGAYCAASLDASGSEALVRLQSA